MPERNGRIITIKQAKQLFGLSSWSIYQAIKNDPTFPVINIGPVKNYRIQEWKLRRWLQTRPAQVAKKGVFIPTGHDLLEELGI